MKARVGMAGEDEGREAGVGHRQPEFLVEFTDQTGFRRLALLELPARKLPQAGERLALRALSDQHPPVDIDEGAGRDEQDGSGGGRVLGHGEGGIAGGRLHRQSRRLDIVRRSADMRAVPRRRLGVIAVTRPRDQRPPIAVSTRGSA